MATEENTTIPAALKEYAHKKEAIDRSNDVRINQAAPNMGERPIESLPIHRELRVMDEKVAELERVVEVLGDRLVFISSIRKSIDMSEPVEPAEASSMLHYLHGYNEKINIIIEKLNSYMEHLEL